MKLVIEIDLDNAAFKEPGGHVEVERILKKYVTVTSTFGVYDDVFLDINGNRVGTAKVTA